MIIGRYYRMSAPIDIVGAGIKGQQVVFKYLYESIKKNRKSNKNHRIIVSKDKKYN